MLPSSLFSEIFPSRRDPDNPGNYLCRFCGKPTIDTRRRYYCSDRCYNMCQLAVSWYEARRIAWKRDGRRCQICRGEVRLHGDRVCESHHIVPVKELWRLAWDVVLDTPLKDLHWRRGDYDPEDPEELLRTARHRAFAIIYTVLYLDVNNLKTLCTRCHDAMHSADLSVPPAYWASFWQFKANPFIVAPAYWASFWAWAKHDRITRTLDQFF